MSEHYMSQSSSKKSLSKIILLRLKLKMIKDRLNKGNNLKEKPMTLKKNMILKCKKSERKCRTIENKLSNSYKIKRMIKSKN